MECLSLRCWVYLGPLVCSTAKATQPDERRRQALSYTTVLSRAKLYKAEFPLSSVQRCGQQCRSSPIWRLTQHNGIQGPISVLESVGLR